MITDALIERYLTGDVPEDLKRRIELQAAGDQALRDRIAQLRRERDQFLAADPPAQFAHRLKTRLDLSEPVKVPWWRRPLVPTLATAMVVLFGIAVLVRLDAFSPKATHERALDDKDEIAAAPSTPAPQATPPPPAPPAAVEAKEEEKTETVAPALAEKPVERRAKDKAAKRDRPMLDDRGEAEDDAQDLRRNKNTGLGGTGRESFGAEGKGAGTRGRYAEPPPATADKADRAERAEKKSADRDADSAWRRANDPAKSSPKDAAPAAEATAQKREAAKEEARETSPETAWRPAPRPSEPSNDSADAKKESPRERAEPRPEPSRPKTVETPQAQGTAGGYAQPPATTAAPPSSPPSAQPVSADDAMNEVAVSAKTTKAPAKGKAKAADTKATEARPDAMAGDLDGAANTPAIVISPLAGTGSPKRLAFLSQSVRVRAGSSVRVTGTAPGGNFAVLLVDGSGRVELVADVRNRSTLALSGRTVTIQKDVALVLVQFQGQLPLAALQADAAKLREAALSLRFIPAALSPRFVRVVVEE